MTQAPPSAATRAIPPSLRDAARRRLARRPAALDRDERRELLEYQRTLAPGGAIDPAAEANVEALGRAETLAIVSGQQCGLLGGPLYAFLKAASAVAAARDLATERGAPVVPIFWLAGDDHDFEEIRSASWTGHDGEAVSFSLPDQPGDSPRVPAFERRFGPTDADALLALLESTTRPTEFRAELFALLREVCAPGVSLEEHFGRLMARLFHGAGLLFCAPRLPFLRKRAASLALRELEQPLATSKLIAAAGERLLRDGVEPALHRPPDALNFFLARGRERCRVRWNGVANGPEVEEAPGEWRFVSTEELRWEIEGHPERVSPNVATRPVVQDMAFPTAAYVGGPGERGYFRQLAEVYAHFGVEMPWIAPRPSLWLVEPKARRSLERLGLSVAELIDLVGAGADAEREMLAERAGSKPLLLAAERLGATLAERIEAVERAAPPTFTRARGAIEKLKKNAGGLVDRLAEAARQDAEQTAVEASSHLAKAKALLAPGGHPQERSANIVAPFLLNYGWEFAERLRALAPAPGESPEAFRLDLPLEADARPSPLDAGSPESRLWLGADI